MSGTMRWKASTPDTALPWVSTTPFGLPVVPEV